MSQKRSRRLRAERTALHAIQLTRYIGQLFHPDDVRALGEASATVGNIGWYPNGDTTKPFVSVPAILLSLATRIQTLIPPTHESPPDPPSPDRLPEPHGTADD